MDYKNFLLILLAFFLQAVFTTIPFGLIVLFILFVLKKDPAIFLYAFAFGILLDIFLLRPIGLTAFFLLSFLFIANMYEKKIESDNIFFVLIFTFLGSILYFSIFNYSLVIIPSIFSAILAGTLFVFLKENPQKKQKYKYMR